MICRLKFEHGSWQRQGPCEELIATLVVTQLPDGGGPHFRAACPAVTVADAINYRLNDF